MTPATNPKVDAFIGRAPAWQGEMTQLRGMLLQSGLTEEVKWGKPCYSHAGANVAIIIPFKDSIALLFFKGTLLKDPHGLLVQQGENSQSGRQFKFTSPGQVQELQGVILEYIAEAIEVEKSGQKVAYKKPEEHPVPEELAAQFGANPQLEAAFKALTPGRQRAYLLHFSSAKQTKTRQARIEKCTPQILAGKGLLD